MRSTTVRWMGGSLVTGLPRAVVAYGVAGLLAWVLAPEHLWLVYGDKTPLKPATAACLVLVGVVLGRLVTGVTSRVVSACAAVVTGETVLAYVLHRPSVTADLLFPDAWAVGTPDGTGQMSFGSGISLLALSLAVFARRNPPVATVLAFIGFTFPYVAVVGHVYGVGDLYSLQTTTGMAWLTALAVMLLAAGLLLDTRMPLGRLLRARGTGGSLTRQLLPWAVAAPPVLGWVLLRGEGVGWYSHRYGLSLLVLAYASSTVLAIFVGARTAARTDQARGRAASELEALNAVLSERVAGAVAEAEEGRARLQLLLERTPVGIFETGADGTRLFTNRRWRELAGVGAGGTEVGSVWTDVLHPDDRERVSALWADALEAGEEFSARYRYLRPDGGVTWVDTTTVAVRNAGGEVLRWLGSVTDVTESVLSESRLSESEQRYRSVLTAMAEGVVMQDAQGCILTANDAAARLLGLSVDEVTGRMSADPRWGAVREDGSDFPAEELPAILASRTGRPVRDTTMGVRRGDGTLVWLQVSSEPLFDTDTPETTAGSVTTFADVTEVRTATAALRRSEEQFRTAMEHAPIGMALIELDGSFREVNRALCGIVGYDEAELLGMTFQQITHPDDLAADLDSSARLIEGTQQHYSTEKRYLTRSGQTVWVQIAVSLARDADGRPDYFVAQAQDITDARASRQLLAHRALHDPLTGLPNRDLLMDRLAQALLDSARGGSSPVVLFCDLDRFKEVNDTYGHEAGDELLVGVAERLRAVMRPGDTVARIGGDEFVVVAEGLPDDGTVVTVAERVRAALSGAVRLAAGTVQVRASVGVAVASADDDARSVLREADAAMYRAKALGRDRLEFGASGGRDSGAPASPGTGEELAARPA